MSSEATRSELVVDVDGSVASYAAVSWAAHEARMHGLPIKLAHVVAPPVISSTMAPTTRSRRSTKTRRVNSSIMHAEFSTSGWARYRRTSTPTSGTQAWLQRWSMRQEVRR